MRIAYASDLHLEFGGQLTTDGLADADVLVLAGDVETSASNWAKFLSMVSKAFGHKPIITVLGNHEYYHNVYPDSLEKYRRAISKLPNIHLLEQESLVLGGVRFLGATLWTDFARGRQALHCAIGMADFRVIMDGGTKTGVSTKRIAQVHEDTVEWLGDLFREHFAGPTVVITHHAPSFGSSHPRFAHSRITGGFCSDMDDLIKEWKPALWIHGHVHDPLDYRIGQTRVICNPWGYPGEGNENRFLAVNIEN